MNKRNFTIRHIKDSNYIIKIKNVKNDCHFSFSHYFARTNFNDNAIAVYKSENSVVLIHEIRSSISRDSKAIFLTKEKWSKVVAETDNMNDVQSLIYLLKKYFWYQNESFEQEIEREKEEFLNQ